MEKSEKPAQNRTVARARAFLAAYRRTCNITASAKLAGIKPRQHYRWIEKYPKYAAAFKRAERVAASALESYCIERATVGWEEPVFYQGDLVRERIYSRDGKKVIGYGRPLTIRRFDGGLAQFLLRGAMPEKYGHKTEITGANGGPLQSRVLIEDQAELRKRLAALSDDELRMLTELTEKMESGSPAVN